MELKHGPQSMNGPLRGATGNDTRIVHCIIISSAYSRGIYLGENKVIEGFL